MPPTPAGWTEDQPLQPGSRSPLPLHIRTTGLEQSGGPRAVQPSPLRTAVNDESPATRSNSALVRSAAVRDASVKGLRERRGLRKSMSDPDSANLAALMVDTGSSSTVPTRAGTGPSGQLSGPSKLGKGREDDLLAPAESQRPATARSMSVSRLMTNDLVNSPQAHDRLRSPISPLGRTNRLQIGGSYNNSGNKSLPTPPLSQKAPASAQSLLPSSNASLPDFDNDYGDISLAQSVMRHQEFLRKESRAANDEERLQVFADYIVAESVLRRRRYSGARQVDLLRIRQRLFDENDAAAIAALQPKIEPSPVNNNVDDQTGQKSRHDPAWTKDYHPALSPIASMSVDEMSSRGRTSSRWWESQTGGSQGESGPLRRSKRESKYMGLSAALMHTMIDENATPDRDTGPQHFYDEGEYPEEKQDPERFGFYDERRQNSRDSATIYGSPNLMDVSRLITLPPPYPRHHPAVNNSHPQLANFRLTVRSLSDLSEIKIRRSRYQVSVDALRSEHEQKVSATRQAFRSNVQSQIAEGSISYAEAAEAEAALLSEEHQAEKTSLQAEFDTLQDVVINPLHDMLNDRLAQLNRSIDKLTEEIRSDALDYNPDRAQQEGDDTPELLEYLTQLKWLSETREVVHKEIFELLTDRNDKYKDIVVLPYRQANNQDKARDTEAFFARDNLDRKRTFCLEAVQRQKALYQIVEDNVGRGVGLQSSAFWDIAPNLVEVLQRLGHLGGVERWNSLEIPEHEYLENPSYYRFPQQYLYTLLDHAEKSTYQFIEGQINLHCLLHEVKSSQLVAECRSADLGKEPSPAPSGSWDEYKAQQERCLTVELKERVRTIEEQWAESLGSALQQTKDQVKQWLVDAGGWDDADLDGS
jgi:predicted transcriptional regulator